jgi:peptidoglycan/xylan/chitin deacetylase (PgdA/CDA1 family)
LPLLLTFDDGYLDFLTDAWPALKRYGFGALVSLVTDRVGGSNEWDAEHGPPIPLMDWDAVADLHHQGIAFAAHSATHRRLTQLDPVEARREILSSKAQLDERLEDEVTTFVYPWSDKSEWVEQLVSDCGFVLALNGRVGIASPNDNPFDLPRIEIEGDATPKTMLDQIARVREQSRATGTPAPPHAPERWSTRARHLRWRVVGKARSLVAGRRKP